MNYNRLDNDNQALKDYIDFHENKLKTMKGFGIKRKRKGGNVFFNNRKQLLKKLELAIGERQAGNNSIKMRKFGVAIVDMLLRTSTIDKIQYNKMYGNYFKL